MTRKMRFRLALDLGTTSLGWAMIRLDADNRPCAVIKAGVRIFSNGRNPKDGSSLAVTRREARAMRRRRDRLLKRKARMLRMLIAYGFFPADESERKALESVNPYTLRAKGLNEPLAPAEFGRALFHLNQRRGFKSSRKADRKDSDSGALRVAVTRLRETLEAEQCRTVGEWLSQRASLGQTVRARFRQDRVMMEDGKARTEKRYDLYVDREMIEHEFDMLWATQAAFNPALFTEAARNDLKDVLLYQRPLRPVSPGRCTFLPDEERAPLALPSAQRFRIYQDVNHLRILRPGMQEDALTLQERDKLAAALERNAKLGFVKIKKLLGLDGAVQFNFEDEKREELKGNITSAILSKDAYLGLAWFDFDEARQDAIVLRLAREENEGRLIRWLQEETGVDEQRAAAIATAGLPEGCGSLSRAALARILPALRGSVVTYDKAVQIAGFDHHSNFGPSSGEVLAELPYYGERLQRHVGFGTDNPADCDEKRYGRIANPTVHIGLNQVRHVVNALIRRYGHPAEVIVEIARDLKQSKEQREEENKRQADNQKRNARLRAEIAALLHVNEENVKRGDIEKMLLWEELGENPAERRCPYSGAPISPSLLLSDEVEIEHILPFAQTLDDCLNNKTVAMREANRAKGNRTPWEAFGAQRLAGFDYAAILARAERMPKAKRYRFGEGGYARWLKDDAGFLARALNDTRYMSKVAREYLSLVCPNTRVIPGRMTALLRTKFALNDVLGTSGEKNRNDHRHHAVDACVIGVTDQGLLQRFASASASARERNLNRLVDSMPLPWSTYREHVRRAVEAVWVSHKPDHGHEGAMHNDTAYALLGNGKVGLRKRVDGQRVYTEETLKVIEIADARAGDRHGWLDNGRPRPYKGYKGDSNYCIEIVQGDKGKWAGEVISTYEAYQAVRRQGAECLRHPALTLSGKPLIMRLMKCDYVRMDVDGITRTFQVISINSAGRVTLAGHQEANVDARNREKDGEWRYTYKLAASLQSGKARRITVSPIGELRDPGFGDVRLFARHARANEQIARYHGGRQAAAGVAPPYQYSLF